MIYPLIKSALFRMSPEKAHYFAMNNFSRFTQYGWQQEMVLRLLGGKAYDEPVEIAGLTFPNRIGLAAGFDKDARWVDTLGSLGFGHVEVGTLTPKPQSGNEKPRLFRLPADQALINRMGFNNQGVEVAASRLARAGKRAIIGGNIGKNKVTPNEKAVGDYEYCFRKLYDVVDYFTVNVSSPNTPGLRELQEKGPLLEILNALTRLRTDRLKMGQKNRPIFLKIAPDLTHGQLGDIIEIVSEAGIDGIVATNTTIERSGLKTPAATVQEIGAGGLSGLPVRKASSEVIRFLHQESQGKFPIIGVGGIFTADDAKEKLDAGASLVQVYTGFIYQGPGIAGQIKKGLYTGR